MMETEERMVELLKQDEDEDEDEDEEIERQGGVRR